MEKMPSPFTLNKRWDKPKNDQQNALVVLQAYLKSRALAKELNQTPTSKGLKPMDSLRKILPGMRNSKVKVIAHSPVLTNGFLIRNKQGEVIEPPHCDDLPIPASLKLAKRKSTGSACDAPLPASLRLGKRKSLKSQIPQSPCTLQAGQKHWDISAEERMADVPFLEPKNLTAELSACDYSREQDTFYVKDNLKDLNIMHATKMDIVKTSSPAQHEEPLISNPLCPQSTPDESLCHVSMITDVSESTMREQPSGLMNLSTGVFHSTLNYPLNSTMMPENIQLPVNLSNSDDDDCNNSTSSIDVDITIPSPSAPDTKARQVDGCEVCKRLRRQIGRCQLQRQHPLVPERRPQAITQSDLNHERTLTVNHSLNVTVGSFQADRGSDDTLVNDVTLTTDIPQQTATVSVNSECHDCSRSFKHSQAQDTSKPSSSSSSSSSSVSSSCSSLNLCSKRKKQLSKRLKQFNRSINSSRRHVEITTLGVF